MTREKQTSGYIQIKAKFKIDVFIYYYPTRVQFPHYPLNHPSQ